MAKSLRKMLAMLLAITMIAGIMNIPVLAGEVIESTEIIENEDDTTTEITTTQTTETDENGKVTVTVTINKHTTGTDKDGVNIDKTETETTVTVTNADGSTSKVTTNEGEETKEWDEDVQPGDNVPEIELNFNGEDSESDKTATGNAEQTFDEDGVKTEINRDAEATLEDNGSSVVKDNTEFESIVAPESYDDKNYQKGTYGKENPQANGLLTGSPAIVKPGQQQSPSDEGAGYDFFLSGLGEATDAAAPVFKFIVYKKDADGNPLVDEKGNYIIDEEKSYLIDGEQGVAKATGMDYQPSQLVLTYKDGSYFYAYCADYLVETDTEPGHLYKMENLEDSGHYSEEDAGKLRAIALNAYWGSESGLGSLASVKALLTEYAATHPTVTVQDKNGKDVEFHLINDGLIDELKEHEALAVSQAAIWAYSINRQDNKDGVDKVEVVGAQSAIKCYNSRGGHLSEYTPANNQDNVPGLTDEEKAEREEEALRSDARMKALFDCLMGLEPISADDDDVSTIINEKNFVDEVALVIKDKVAEGEVDEEGVEHDVYNTDLTFTLAFVPDAESDDLLVYLTDAEGNVITDKNGDPIVRRLAGENSEGREADTIYPDENGVYTLTGLQLSENSDFVFDIRLDGTQYLKNGVYLYTAEGGRLASQTLVGLAKGTREFEVSASMTLSFNVDESKHVVAEREWFVEEDPQFTPPTTPPTIPEEPVTPPTIPEEPVTPPTTPEEPVTPPTTPEEPVTPPTTPEEPVEELEEIPEEEIPLVDIPEEEVPLAIVPQTGDISYAWIIVSMLIVCCIFGVAYFDKSRRAA